MEGGVRVHVLPEVAALESIDVLSGSEVGAALSEIDSSSKNGRGKDVVDHSPAVTEHVCFRIEGAVSVLRAVHHFDRNNVNRYGRGDIRGSRIGANHCVFDGEAVEILETAIPLAETDGRRARGQLHMVRSGFKHRLGIENLGIDGFLRGSDAGTRQHKGCSQQTGYGKTSGHTLYTPGRLRETLLSRGIEG